MDSSLYFKFGGIMKKLVLGSMFMVAFLFFAVPLAANAQTENVKKMSSNEQAIYLAAMNLLSDEDYSVLEQFQVQNKTGAISFVFDKQLTLITQDKTSLKEMKSKAMFCLGEKASFPIYIRRESDFFTSLVSGYLRTSHLVKVDEHPVSMALAAKISHEIFHVNNPGIAESEVLAIQHEQKIFNGYKKNFAQTLAISGLASIVSDYSDNLDKDLRIAKAGK